MSADFGADLEEADGKNKADIDLMEDLTHSNFINPNDSFDRIFNKELDLELGKILST